MWSATDLTSMSICRDCYNFDISISIFFVCLFVCVVLTLCGLVCSFSILSASVIVIVFTNYYY